MSDHYTFLLYVLAGMVAYCLHMESYAFIFWRCLIRDVAATMILKRVVPTLIAAFVASWQPRMAVAEDKALSGTSSATGAETAAGSQTTKAILDKFRQEKNYKLIYILVMTAGTSPYIAEIDSWLTNRIEAGDSVFFLFCKPAACRKPDQKSRKGSRTSIKPWLI